MRRKNKYIITGAAIGFGTIVLADILIQWLHHINEEKTFTWNSFNGKQTLKNGLIGSLLGAGVGFFIYKKTTSMEADLPFYSDEYLRKILSEENLKADPRAFERLLSYRREIKQWLSDVFNDSLVSEAEDSGSFFKRTAILSRYDLDIVLPFKKDSFKTLEDMYYYVCDVVEKKFKSKAIVTEQTKAIGLTFDNNGNPIHFDIIPGREINNYVTDRELNLYVKPDWIWQKGSSFKTNIFIQRKITANKPHARSVIKLLKRYRLKNGFDLSSALEEQSVVEALSSKQYGTHLSITQNLLNSMDYLATRLENSTFIDLANSNNNLNAKKSEEARLYLAEQLIKDIEMIESNPRYIKEIFED